MKTLRIWMIVLVCMTACNPLANTTPVPFVPSTLNDELAPYRSALIPASQSDVDSLDRATRYDLTLTYDAVKYTLAGAQDVLYFNQEIVPLNEIYFRLFASYPDSGGMIAINRLAVDGAAATATYEAQNTALKIPLARPLPPNGSTRIRLEFTLKIPPISKGHYADYGFSNTVVTLPSVLPLIPVYDDKGWHIAIPPRFGDLVYADISLYAVTMTVPSKMNVIASGSTLDARDNGDGTTTWRIVAGPMRDFDINLSDQLQRSSTTIGETTIHSYYEAADAQAGQDALKIAADAFREFQNRFGAYPYRELDIVETPTTAGGIEYPGVIVVGRELYSNPSQRDFFEFATVHEVSHQWWYAMVGNDQVNFPWVDEALAQYSTLMYAEAIRGKANAQQVLKNYFQNLYDRAKTAGRDAAVNQPVAAFDENDYGAIVYGKGPLFYDAIRKKMGDEKFYQFLRTYFAAFRYKIAYPEDILKTAESTCTCSLQDEYKQWILSPAK
ncbi:MAG: M1 family metallopeptidase [Chloroflexi bacterium]|nr:M1 family metallopeptidase [Chloroflexota bacterium]